MIRALLVSCAAAVCSLASAAALAAAAAVDIQFSVCDAPAHVERALGLHAHGALQQVWLFDDPALTLFGKGLRIRLRGAHGADFELTLKAAGHDCSRQPELAASEGKCEYDLHDGKVAGALSLTRSVDATTAQQLVAGSVPLASVLSPAQTRFMQRVAGAWPLPAGMRALGPQQVRSYRAQGKSYAVDISELPGGERFIEVSRKVRQADAQRLRDELQAELTKAGVALCTDQSAQAVNKLRSLLRKP
jgi:hypothetical protein